MSNNIFLSDMCTNKKWIINRYTGQRLLVDCGHCKSCLQTKAAKRSSRIRNEYDGKTCVYFGTLTYSRLACPYFNHSELKGLYDGQIVNLPIYRNFDVKWIPSKQKYKKIYKKTKIADVVCTFDKTNNIKWMPYLKKRYDEVGVIFYKDIQNFYKRLRQNLKRNGFNKPFKVFSVAEYGSKTQRPHFHFLLFTDSVDEAFLHNSVIKSWPFDHQVRSDKAFQFVSRDPASYVSSYVNCGATLPSFLAENFEPKHSASKYFGHGRNEFTLESILASIGKRDMSYSVARIKDSIPQVVNLPIPKYVVNRYFPIFKGYSRLDDSAVRDFILSSFNCCRLSDSAFGYNKLLARKTFLKEGVLLPISEYRFQRYALDYSGDDLNKLQVRLNNAFQYYHSVTGNDISQYAVDFVEAWKCYKNTSFRLFKQREEIPDFKYDNLCFLPPDVLEYYLHEYGFKFPPVLNVNERPDVVCQTIKMAQLYDKYDKQKKVSNIALTSQGVNV